MGPLPGPCGEGCQDRPPCPCLGLDHTSWPSLFAFSVLLLSPPCPCHPWPVPSVRITNPLFMLRSRGHWSRAKCFLCPCPELLSRTGPRLACPASCVTQVPPLKYGGDESTHLLGLLCPHREKKRNHLLFSIYYCCVWTALHKN